MKTMMTMKSFALAAMMMMAMTASADNKSNSGARGYNMSECRCKDCTRLYNNRGYNNTVVFGRGDHSNLMRECYCKDCQKIRKALDKHMMKKHYGKQNRMTCHTCMEYSHKLNMHMQMLNNNHGRNNHGGMHNNHNSRR